MANMYQQSQLRRCAYNNRGCTATVRQENLLSHYQECGFAPVQCSHDGCQVTVNRQDVISHQQSCEFRSVTCEECDEPMKQRDYEKHNCVLQRRLAEVTRILQEFQGGQCPANQPHATRGKAGNNLVQPARQLTSQQTQPGAGILQFETTQVEQVVTRRFSSQVVGQSNSTPRALPRRRVNGLQLAAPSTSDADYFRAACSISSSQRQPSVGGEIVVAGGLLYSSEDLRSYEIFNWYTQQWTLFKNALFFDHPNGFSFFYDNKVMFCGGARTNRLECLDIANYRTVSTFPAQLPEGNCGKGVLCGDRIVTFGQYVSATSLKNPFGSSVLVRYDDERQFSNYGITRVNYNAVVVVGGNNSYIRIKYDGRGREYKVPEKNEYTDDVALYNPSTNVMKTLAPLPCALCDTTLVAHGENVIILGGRKGHYDRCNEVLMYNITKQQCSRLPSMLEERSNCAAVIMGDTIAVFGGESTNERYETVYLKTAEYLVLGENTWKKLTSMHFERMGATACVLP